MLSAAKLAVCRKIHTKHKMQCEEHAQIRKFNLPVRKVTARFQKVK